MFTRSVHTTPKKHRLLRIFTTGRAPPHGAGMYSQPLPSGSNRQTPPSNARM